jgi:hypothetical protein
MKIVDRFLNRSEEIVFKELTSVAADNGLRAFAKPRLSDVLLKDGERLSDRLFSFYTRAHFDFLVTDHEFKPVMAVEYDGPFHVEGKQAERDTIKNDLCGNAELPLLRIGAKHVTKKYRGMTLLRWIIEVTELQSAFDDAQAKGQIPYDEAFDPASIASDGTGRSWPYWLSAEANVRINKFIRAQPGAKAWISLLGHDDRGNAHSFSYLNVDGRFLYVKTAARNQGASIPVYDMLSEVTNCELDEQLAGLQRGDVKLLPLQEFKSIHDRICQRYGMRRRSSMGTGLDWNVSG